MSPASRITVLGVLALLCLGNAPAGRYGKSPLGDTVLDTQANLLWQAGVMPSSDTQAAAATYCAGLSSQGGGWRLPRLPELLTLVDEHAAYPPALDTRYFTLLAQRVLWTSTPVISSSSAWAVDFNDGRTVKLAPTGSASALCVHDI